MKKSGVALLATIISIAVLLLVSGGFFTIMASNTGLIKSSGESLQAQYFAQLEADIIKMLSYDEVDNITQDTWQEFDIDNSWQYKVNVGPEQNVGDSDNTMKIASISVRKSGDTIDRFALDVPLSSQGNNNSSIGFPDWNNYICWRYNGVDFYNNSYVAPDNGYFSVFIMTSHEAQCHIYINDIKVNHMQSGADNLSVPIYPVSKGDVLKIVPSSYMKVYNYGIKFNMDEIRFFYCRK